MDISAQIETLKEFWALVVDVWTSGLFGADIGHILIAFGIFFLFVIFRRLFSRIVIDRLKKLTARSKSSIDDNIVDALEKPVRFIPIVVGVFFASGYLNPEGALETFFTNLNRSLVAFTIFWALYSVIGPFSQVIRRLRDIFSVSMLDWFIKALKVLIILIGGATILEIWGIAVAPLIAGLGLFGVAVALGAQDLFKNLIAGIFILGERRFQVGDWVLVEGEVEGTVELIGFRTTRIRRFDRAPVFVPNSKLSDNVVTNFSKMTHRRIYWMIGVEYRTTVDQLRKIRDEIEAYVHGSEDFAPPSEVSTFVRIDKFSDSSIDIMLYCFTRTTNWGEWLEIKEQLACEIKRIVESNGTGFAFPSRSIYVETMPPAEIPEGRPEPFPLPAPSES